MEFQFRGSPHIHSFLWILDPPVLSSETLDIYKKFVDSTIQAYLPDEHQDKELYDLVKKYQTHRHSKSCRKYKNKPCRYYYGRFFTKETIIAIPLANNLSLEEKSFAITNRNNILSKVKCYIDEFLDPSKPNYESNETIESILLRLGISDENYYQALSLSSSTDYELHLKRPPNSCFINNYNPVMLLAWKANMDLQPVFNYYKAISYMCAYFSKSETESSNALVQASKEIKTMKMSARDSMYKLASAFATSRQMYLSVSQNCGPSLQEAVSFSLPELWQRKCYPKSIFVNTNIPSKLCL